jgi:tRNA(fMet)-specific endonuclease VapC
LIFANQLATGLNQDEYSLFYLDARLTTINSKRVEENLKRITVFKKYLTICSDSEKSAEVFGRFKSVLKSKGNIIEDFDILIASIAFTNNYILVTNNPKHFQRIKELQIENWIP